MPTNPFRRKGTQRGSTPPTTRRTNYARNGQKGGGLRIAASNVAPRHNGFAADEGISTSQSSTSVPLLPPESDYRTSLIMPHLTKRFTLLRAPDGSMVTPDAMRAHLRAQRARARATGVPGTQCFLTEEEEDEIIDQLKRQTRMEEMDDMHYAQGAQTTAIPAQSIQFGGTDGFGSWASPSLEQQPRMDSQIDSSLTDSLGALHSSASTSSRDGGSGGFFSRSSTTRDLAYMREVERSRAAKREEEQASNVVEPGDGVDEETEGNALPQVQEEEEEGEGEDQVKDDTLQDSSPLDPPDSQMNEDADVSMPGDFLVAEQRQSRRLSVSDAASSRKGSDTSTLTSRPQHARQPALLTSLTPEAFTRVSSALEELYDMVQGRVSEGEEEEDDDQEIDKKGAAKRSADANIDSVDTASVTPAEPEEEEELDGGEDDAVAVYRRRRAPISPETDVVSLPKSSIDEGSSRIRASIDSESNSFTSARSDVNPSALGVRAEAFAGIGAAAMHVGNSTGTLPAAPTGWQVSPVSANIPLAAENRPAIARNTKSSLVSVGESNQHSQSSESPASRNVDLVAVEPSSEHLKDETTAMVAPNAVQDEPASGAEQSLGIQDPQKTPTAPLFRSPINSFMSTSSAGPLSAGFQIGGMAPSDRAAAAAAATAAGVAASNFVAQAQKQQRDRLSAAPTLTPSSPPKSEITVGPMPSAPPTERSISDEGKDEPTAAVPAATDINIGSQGSKSPVLSAGAIAARSPRYFPAASRQSMRTYAAGFHPSVPLPNTDATRQISPDAPQATELASIQATESATTPSTPPAPSAPKVVAAQSSSLFPEPPADAVEGIKWRERYGMASADAHSIRSGTSFHISEDEDADDEAQDEDEDDVWARVARNTSPKVEPRRISVLQGSTESNGLVKSGSGMSLDALAQMQNDLVRSASALRNGSIRSPPPSIPSYPPPAPPPQSPPPNIPRPTSSGSRSRASEVPSGTVQHSTSDSVPTPGVEAPTKSTDSTSSKLDKARARARMIAEQRSASSSQEPRAEVTSTNSVESSRPDNVRSIEAESQPMSVQGSQISNISGMPPQRDSTSQASRSQVLYDVTSSHRPTSPPPRSHKTSLSNLPTLHDLARAPSLTQLQTSPVWTPPSADRNSVSLLAMMENTSRVHDHLAAGGDTSLTGRDNMQSVAESEEFEDVQVEDGFGGFVTERRPIPRSQSHNVLSNYGKQRKEEREEAAAHYEAQRAVDPAQDRDVIHHTPKSIQSESAVNARGDDDPTWSRLPGTEPSFNPVLIDDVAAQARAATRALKGDQGGRPRMRTKSLSNKARKQMVNNISQPQLLTTTQRMEHAKALPRPDASLRRRDIAGLQEQIAPRTSSRQMSNSVSRRGTAAPMQRTPSGNTVRSPRSSPTDYKSESMANRKNSVASSHLSRSSSFGNRPRTESSTARALSPAQTVASIDRTRQSPGTPSSARSSQTGLSRFMSRLRTRKGVDLPAVIEPFPSSNGGDDRRAAAGAMDNLSSPMTHESPSANTPGSLATPKFHTPRESPGQITPSPIVTTYPGHLVLPQASNTPLSEMFANSSPAAINSIANGGEDRTSSLLAPAAPIHARQARQRGANGQDALTTKATNSTVEGKSARDTIVRRTIIVSTFDPVGDDRRKSNVAGNRKNSLRKPVDRQSHASQQPTGPSNHHRRSSSLSSVKSRSRSLHDRPPTPPGPDGVSGSHRRKLSQEMFAKPLPATARNVYEAPTSSNGEQQASALHVPSGGVSRTSAVSDYGVSLYDMYIDDDDGGLPGARSSTHRVNSNLVPPQSSKHSSAIRQSINESGNGNPGARHIEVTERADGSVVWQVIAGLADRSSSYSASIGDYRPGGGHSRQTSDTSQYSFLRNNPITGPVSHPNAYADEDGRSLFARTRGKKSFSIDGEGVPPLPPGLAVRDSTAVEGSSSVDQQSIGSARPSINSNRSQPAQQLDFEMALPPGQAATRIVYTSDAELAAILESLAGPDKSSAKFAFQRVIDDSNGQAQSTAELTPKIGDQDRNGKPRESRDGVPRGRPVSIWTEEELSNDPLGLVRNQRIKIEAEIYSLLQRGQAMSPPATERSEQDRRSALMPPPPVPNQSRSAAT